MESAFLLLAALSGVSGFVVGNRITSTIRRLVFAIGTVALALGLTTIALLISDRSPITVWTGGLIALFLFIVAVATLPFAIGSFCRRWIGRSTSGRDI